MRIRSTKPEFWRSETIARLSWEDRLLLKGLESYVDDNGVGKDDVALVTTDLFPRDILASPRETFERVSEGLSRIHTVGLIHRYDTDHGRMLFVSNWERIQRIDKPSKGRFPRPDGTFNYGESEIRETLASPPETLAPGTGEQGNRGTGEQGGTRASALSPFCPKHSPNGPDGKSCRACGDARRAFDGAAASAKAQPSPRPFTVLPGALCADGKHTLLADGTCTRCTYRKESA